MKRKQPKAFEPYCVYDAMGFIRQTWIAVEQEGEVVRLLVSDTTCYELFAREVLEGQIAPMGGYTRYVRSSTMDPISMAEAYKLRALQFGATPDAIRLLGLLCPLNEEDKNTMAEKLKGKGKGNVVALKEAAKAVPVAASKRAAKAKAVPEETAAAPKIRASKQKQFETMKKAREMGAEKRQEELLKDRRKITLTDKGKAKAATKPADDLLNIMKTSKTVGAAIASEQVKLGDIKYAERTGLIELV